MLFDASEFKAENLILPNAKIFYVPSFYNKEMADFYFKTLYDDIIWREDSIKIFGKSVLQPRLTALYGDVSKNYSYSNLKMTPIEWTSILLEIKRKVEAICDEKFTSVLLNLYRDGNDSNGWHADNEKELGINPTIASLSFGIERDFLIKHNTLIDCKKTFVLEHGSLLVMSGEMQHFWKHQLPKRKKIMQPRINLTFRKII